MVDIALLKAEIEDLGIPKNSLAVKCKMSRQTLDNKLENPNSITAQEAYLFSKALRIEDKDRLLRIFFAPDVE